MKGSSLTSCLILLLVGAAPAQVSAGIQLIGGCDTPGEAYCVAVRGDHAYVADGDSGLRVISVADPANPTEVGHCDTPGWARGVAVSGHYAYVACYDSGLHIVSVADPAQPVIVGHCDTRGKAVGVSVDASYAYVAASDSGLRIISVADPTHPVEVGQCQVARSANAVAANGDFAYVGDSYGLAVISVADPAHPYTASGYLFSAPVLAAAVKANRACVTVKQQAMHVFSVDDSARITHLGQCGHYYWAHGAAIGGDCAYVAADEDGLRIISIADPAHPVQVASFDAPNWWANGVSVVGDYVYVAYGSAGLQIFQSYSGVEEPPSAEGRSGVEWLPTVARGALRMEDRGPDAGHPAELLDITGHAVIALRPGVNDVTGVASGVYFIRSAQGEAQAVRKVVVTR